MILFLILLFGGIMPSFLIIIFIRGTIFFNSLTNPEPEVIYLYLFSGIIALIALIILYDIVRKLIKLRNSNY